MIERDIRRRLIPSGRPEYAVLIASAILSMAIGFYTQTRQCTPTSSMVPLRWSGGGRTAFEPSLSRESKDRQVSTG